MSTRLTPGAKTPISERISIFEQKQQTTVTPANPAVPSPGRIQISSMTKKTTITTSTTISPGPNKSSFNAIKSAFSGGVTPPMHERSASPVTPSPPTSLRNFAASTTLNIKTPSREAPTPTARVTVKQPVAAVRSVSPTRPPSSTTFRLTPLRIENVANETSLNSSKSSPVSENDSFSFHQQQQQQKSTTSTTSTRSFHVDDRMNGNLSTSTPTAVDNLNEWNKIRQTSVDKNGSSKFDSILDDSSLTSSHGHDLDNVRSKVTSSTTTTPSSLKTSNLNLKNNLSSSVNNSGSQVRGTYWTEAALQNENSQKMSEALKLDLDFKDEKISSLTKEMDDLHTGGATEEEVANLKRQKHELEMRLKEEEEEIDDLAGQVQLLEQSKVKLEMSIAAMKKEHRREMANKEEELEDARAANQKKVKSLEQQLENEHEERLNFVREKHELETKILNLQELAARSADEEQVSKLKKDLKRTKALLKDAQLMIERSKSDSSNKVVMRQLKNQLEDSEFARTAAIKAKQNLELELSDVQQQLDDVLRSKSDLEDRLLRMSREKADLSTQLEDSEEELQEVMRKYKASVAQLSVDQITIQEQSNRIADLEDERNRMKEQIAELTQRIESLEGDTIVNTHQNRLEMKIKELESKLELEQTTRGRMETQINRLKEGIEKVNSECDSLRNKELASQEAARKLQRQLRDLREDYAGLQQKETEVNSKKNELEKQLELSEAETVLAKNDLKLAMKRIEDLQTAINVELDSESDSANSDSDSSEEGMESFLDHHRRAVSVQRERESVAREAEARASIQREVRASIARESVARTLHTMHEEPELKLSEGSTLLEETESSFQSETDAAESTA